VDGAWAGCLVPVTFLLIPYTLKPIQIEFLPQCHKVAIMDGGNMLYFGPFDERARELLSKVVPASHLLAAAGAAEQPRDPVDATKSKSVVRRKTSTVTDDSVGKGKSLKPSKSVLNVGASGSLTYMDKAKVERRVCLTTWEAMKMYYKESPWWGILFWICFIIFLGTQTSRQVSKDYRCFDSVNQSSSDKYT